MKYTTRLPAVEFADPLIRLREEARVIRRVWTG